MAEKFIQGAIKKPGALRAALHVKDGKNIPAKKLHEAAEKGGKLGQRARLAETLKAMHGSHPVNAQHEGHKDHEGGHHGTDGAHKHGAGRSEVERLQKAHAEHSEKMREDQGG